MNLLPFFIRYWLADKLVEKISADEAKLKRLKSLLNDVEPGYDHTQTFRDHIITSIEDITALQGRRAAWVSKLVE